MTRLLLFLLVLFYINCTSTNRQNQETKKRIDIHSTQTNFWTDVHKTRLGESNYFILLPDKFDISEAQGKEGQLGYYIVPRDTTSTMSVLIGIRRGDPIVDTSLYDNRPMEIISSFLLSKQVEWKIFKTETGYFYAFTDEKGDLNANAFAKNRMEIDSLISIVSSLRQE